MAKVSHQPKPKDQWSKEKLRQRGVRAVVEVLRLRQEHQQLSHANAGYLQLNAVLRRYLEQVQLLNQFLRASLDQRNNPDGRRIGKGNYWVNGNHSAETNGTARVN